MTGNGFCRRRRGTSSPRTGAENGSGTRCRLLEEGGGSSSRGGMMLVGVHRLGFRTQLGVKYDARPTVGVEVNVGRPSFRC